MSESLKAFNTKTNDPQAITGTDLGSGKRALDVFSNSSEYSTFVDEASSTVTYVGKAIPGSSASSAVWQIKKITITGSVTSIQLANGSSSFAEIWDNRASLTYT